MEQCQQGDKKTVKEITVAKKKKKNRKKDSKRNEKMRKKDRETTSQPLVTKA